MRKMLLNRLQRFTVVALASCVLLLGFTAKEAGAVHYSGKLTIRNSTERILLVKASAKSANHRRGANVRFRNLGYGNEATYCVSQQLLCFDHRALHLAPNELVTLDLSCDTTESGDGGSDCAIRYFDPKHPGDSVALHAVLDASSPSLSVAHESSGRLLATIDGTAVNIIEAK